MANLRVGILEGQIQSGTTAVVQLSTQDSSAVGNSKHKILL